MGEEAASNACGNHTLNGRVNFDYTCDECMLPLNWKDYTDDPRFNDSPHKEKGIRGKAAREKTARRVPRGTKKVPPF